MSDTDRFALVLERTLNAPHAAVWRCWTQPELLMQWFCPKPWRVTQARLDVRAGGEFFTRMEGPDGEVNDGPGQFLEVVSG